MTHIVWLFHMLPLKRRVYDEVPIVGDDRTSYRWLGYNRLLFLNWCLPFATAMRRVAFGDPRIWCRFWRTLAYAKGTTSMGTPGLNYVKGVNFEPANARKTHVRSQVVYVLTVIGHEDEPRMIWVCWVIVVGDKPHVRAASASTFSRRWHAPPPLMQLRLRSTLHVCLVVPVNVKPIDSLVSTV